MKLSIVVLGITLFTTACGKSDDNKTVKSTNDLSLANVKAFEFHDWKFSLPAGISDFGEERTLDEGATHDRVGYQIKAFADDGTPLTFDVSITHKTDCSSFAISPGLSLAQGTLNLKGPEQSQYYFVQANPEWLKDAFNINLSAGAKWKERNCVYLRLISKEAFDPKTGYSASNSNLLGYLLKIASSLEYTKTAKAGE